LIKVAQNVGYVFNIRVDKCPKQTITHWAKDRTNLVTLEGSSSKKEK
jgi:hypothetical protein